MLQRNFLVFINPISGTINKKDIRIYIQQKLTDLQYSFDVVFRENSSLRPRLEPFLKQALQKTDVATQSLKKDILHIEQIVIQPIYDLMLWQYFLYHTLQFLDLLQKHVEMYKNLLCIYFYRFENFEMSNFSLP